MKKPIVSSNGQQTWQGLAWRSCIEFGFRCPPHHESVSVLVRHHQKLGNFSNLPLRGQGVIDSHKQSNRIGRSRTSWNWIEATVKKRMHHERLHSIGQRVVGKREKGKGSPRNPLNTVHGAPSILRHRCNILDAYRTICARAVDGVLVAEGAGECMEP